MTKQYLTRVDKDKIKELMTKRGIRTYLDLCEASGISTATLYRAFNSSQGFNSQTLDSLANALQADPREFIETGHTGFFTMPPASYSFSMAG